MKCHGGEKVKGKVDFVTILDSDQSLAENFELWESVRDVLAFEEMPPEDELQPGDRERKEFLTWYQKHFVDSVEAKPGDFQPRRLSVHEYRNTLRSLFGFELEVAVIEAEQTVTEKSLVRKLLPTDPPGESGFTNDTHGNPLTTVIWDQYSYLVDRALKELFSARRKPQLAAFTGVPEKSEIDEASAKRTVEIFASRAWRRPASEEDLTTSFRNLEGLAGDSLREQLQQELKAILMSPQFFYRGLLVEGSAGQQAPVDTFELAERLSYFLWADMPDAELSRLAVSGALAKPEVLKAQITRLLDDPASRNLADNFALEWLALDEIGNAEKNPPVADALLTQPLDFVDYLFREDRPLVELIDSPTTFINQHTARFYPSDRKQLAGYQRQKGIEVESLPNQRITLEHHADSRGGILTMPGILTMNRGPVIRGTWILERILGDHLGEPPADVGQVAPNRKGETLSFRERFEQHRNQSACAVCHDKIDPLGFALQAYDDRGVDLLDGATAKAGGKKNEGGIDPASLDTSGQLPTGESFANFAELKNILISTQRRTVIRNLVDRTLSYALCRKTEMFDQPTIEEITERLMNDEATFRDLVQDVVFSLPFQETTFPVAES